ncbi:MAG: SprB repeat-containing protein [Bacteroidetes bacterium]|nr:SprB repeat-containing protein [Bacteroidota bacterium]
MPVLSGGPFGFGAITLSSPVVASNGPYTLNVSTLGFFNDNFTNWAVMCNGNPIASGCLEGTVYGGSLCANSGFISIPNLSCSGSSSVNRYSYLWSNGQTTQTATGLAAGTHTVTVTDANGCTITDSIVVTEPAVLVITPTQTNVSCNGQSTGSATASVTGGTLQYTYTRAMDRWVLQQRV